jgi:hypothetical protein
MGVSGRVKLKSDKKIEKEALLRSGYESLRPEIIIPKGAASKLGIFPPPPEVTEKEYITVGKIRQKFG